MDELRSQGIKDTIDVAKVTTNVSIALPVGPGNQPAITIRGIGLNDYNTNNAGPNGVYVDDIYISAPEAQSFGIFDLDQVQVLKGPQGTLYGRNTSGGALLFNSIKPTDTIAASGSVEYSSFNTFQIVGGLSGPLVPDLSGRISFVVNHSDGYMRNDLTGQRTSGADNQALRAQLLYAPDNGLKVLLGTLLGRGNNIPGQYRHVGTFLPST